MPGQGTLNASDLMGVQRDNKAINMTPASGGPLASLPSTQLSVQKRDAMGIPIAQRLSKQRRGLDRTTSSLSREGAERVHWEVLAVSTYR